ncbi:hypothetical protein ERO13_A05G375500v2 [Gossypium hirsutum]|uniref:Knottins-like domain-containing protein n=6 Tax=Gossypium TaxID=3633 RepID=A0ABR0Q7C7_GOSAR|nr:defensin-like protein 1 [Gossypium arboreum]KAB2085355.1 hypothetical protein ES319_A05G394300v1 [Gossypium barbadense]KAG4203028.1 hypothetical protein ERO13_A05G375500v2 [Gossypium hirsutum]TYH20308.1 hypothetical protein ES288_A05G420700v1 [Gossypium darwinii]TYI30971.1 hypothetical protein ES332_A05G422000v1 [Gossypium tomentosum]TYJ37893.1 hypothetical protein E1A91_A05G406300v1 [Gossypium mustelinum]
MEKVSELAVEMGTKKLFGMMFMLLLLVALASHGGVVEGRICESKSHRFKGVCLSDHNCGLVCRNEGFLDGWCRGFRHRCFCTRNC